MRVRLRDNGYGKPFVGLAKSWRGDVGGVFNPEFPSYSTTISFRYPQPSRLDGLPYFHDDFVRLYAPIGVKNPSYIASRWHSNSPEGLAHHVYS